MSLNNSIISFDQAFNNNFNWEKDHLEQDDAVSYESHNQDCCLNQKTKINEECCANLENKKTNYEIDIYHLNFLFFH